MTGTKRDGHGPSSPRRVLVLGVGNPLVGDEGVGVRVIAQLMGEYDFPEHVELVDSGTMGFGMLDVLRTADRVLVIDAVDGTGHAPGTVVRLLPEDIAPNTVFHSLHDTRLVDVLQAASLLGREPETICLGVQIAAMEQWVLDLTPQVEAAVPVAVAAALSELHAWGVQVSPRTDPGDSASVVGTLRTQRPLAADHRSEGTG